MPLSNTQEIQFSTLSLFLSTGGEVVGGLTCPEVAAKLQVDPAAVRQRCIRYEREGWLARAQVEEGQGWRYTITSRGISRALWLKSQLPKEEVGFSISPWWLLSALVAFLLVLWLTRHDRERPPRQEALPQ